MTKMYENYYSTSNQEIPEIFSQEEISKIIKQIGICKDYWKKGGYKDWGDFFRMRDICLIATSYLLALRPQEVCNLKFSDFDWKRAIVKIRRNTRKNRKPLVLPVPSSLLKLYKRYFLFPRLRFWKGSRYLFPSFENNHISPERLKGIFREKCLKPLGLWKMPEECKIPKFRLYTLRHTRLSQIYNKTKDLFLVKNFAGHSDIRSTLVYLHTDDEYQEYIRKQIEI